MKLTASVALLTIACMSTASEPTTQTDNLALEIATRCLPIGRSVPIEIDLVNRGNSTAEVCLVDGGISVWMRMPETGQMVPVCLYGFVTDTPCWRKVASNREKLRGSIRN